MSLFTTVQEDERVHQAAGVTKAAKAPSNGSIPEALRARYHDERETE
jgi:hypothetical protein